MLLPAIATATIGFRVYIHPLRARVVSSNIVISERKLLTMSSKSGKRASKADKKAVKDAKPAPHGAESCTMQPADKCSDKGDCMLNGCSLHGRTGRS